MTLTEPELLAAGPDAAPRRWPWLVAAVLAALLALAWWADGQARGAELDAVADRIEAAEVSLDQGDARVAAMLAYGQPLLSRATLEPSLRADLQALVRQAHGDAAALTAQSRADLAGVPVLAWHGDVAAAVAAYDAYLAAREQTSREAAVDVEVGFARHPEHDALLAVARAALVRAAAADRDAAARVEQALPAPE